MNWTKPVEHELGAILSSPQAQLTLWCNGYYNGWKLISGP